MTAEGQHDDAQPLPTPEQIRAARGWLRLSQDQLVEAANLTKRTLVRLELGEGVPREETLRAARDALAAMGVEFLFDGMSAVGIRVRAPRLGRRPLRKRGSHEDV